MPNQWTLYFNIWNDSLQQKSEAKDADVQIGSDDILYVSIKGSETDVQISCDGVRTKFLTDISGLVSILCCIEI